MSMCLKQRGLALLCMNVSGSLQVPAALAHPNRVTLSLGFLKFFAWVSPECTRLLDGISLHHNPVSSALKIWLRVYPSSSIFSSSLFLNASTAEASADSDSPCRDIPLMPCRTENLWSQPELALNSSLSMSGYRVGNSCNAFSCNSGPDTGAPFERCCMNQM